MDSIYYEFLNISASKFFDLLAAQCIAVIMNK